MLHKAGLKSMAEDTPGLLLLPIPSPHPGCSRYSVAQRRDSSLHVFCVLLLSTKHSDTPLQLPLVSIPISSFSSFLALLFSFQHCTHDWHMLLPLPAHKASGPDSLSNSFGAVFLISYCISVHTSVTCAWGCQWVPLLLALSPCPATSLCGDAEGTSTCLVSWLSLFVCRQPVICTMCTYIWKYFQGRDFFFSVAFSNRILGSYTHSNSMTVIFVQNDKHVLR